MSSTSRVVFSKALRGCIFMGMKGWASGTRGKGHGKIPNVKGCDAGMVKAWRDEEGRRPLDSKRDGHLRRIYISVYR